MKRAHPYRNRMIARGLVLVLIVTLGSLGIMLAACQMRVPPRATALNPICLFFCFTRAEVGDDSTNSVQHTYQSKPATKAAKPVKPASAASAARTASAPLAISAPLPASAPLSASTPDFYKH